MPSAASSATSTIDLNHPALTAVINLDNPSETWKPPIPWGDLDLSPSDRAWVDELVRLNLLPKADSALTCRRFYRPILQYLNHYIRCAATTCHLKTCRNCGTGKMRAHRIFAADPKRFRWITSQPARTIHLRIRHEQPATSPAAYLLRLKAERRQVVNFRRRLRREYGSGLGVYISLEPDPHWRDSLYRLYVIGHHIDHNWIRRTWQLCVGLGAESESRYWHPDQAADGLRWTLDSLIAILLLGGAERAQWEQTLMGTRLTAASGALRGLDDDRTSGIEIPGSSEDAPYGHCPCGCGGVVERSSDHGSYSYTELSSRARIVEIGSLKDYSAIRHKVTELGPRGDGIFPFAPIAAASPPS